MTMTATPMLRCLACGEAKPIHDGRTRCPCGRSVSHRDDAVVEIRGPGRVLVPADDLVTIDGLPWMTMPEEPKVVRPARSRPRPGDQRHLGRRGWH